VITPPVSSLLSMYSLKLWHQSCLGASNALRFPRRHAEVL
jgi:hypothetical protein